MARTAFDLIDREVGMSKYFRQVVLDQGYREEMEDTLLLNPRGSGSDVVHPTGFGSYGVVRVVSSHGVYPSSYFFGLNHVRGRGAQHALEVRGTGIYVDRRLVGVYDHRRNLLIGGNWTEYPGDGAYLRVLWPQLVEKLGLKRK
jgi:hypothetical protein